LKLRKPLYLIIQGVSKRGEAPLFFVPPPSEEREIKGVRLIKNSAII